MRRKAKTATINGGNSSCDSTRNGGVNYPPAHAEDHISVEFAVTAELGGTLAPALAIGGDQNLKDFLTPPGAGADRFALRGSYQVS